MLPVLWHHPFVCFCITHLDENGSANLTQTLTGASQVPSAHNPGVWAGAAADLRRADKNCF